MADLAEPPHIHVNKDKHEAKFWLEPIVLAKSVGFKQHQLNEIERILKANQSFILEVWYIAFIGFMRYTSQPQSPP